MSEQTFERMNDLCHEISKKCGEILHGSSIMQASLFKTLREIKAIAIEISSLMKEEIL